LVLGQKSRPCFARTVSDVDLGGTGGYPEPPLAGSEADTLVGSLERQRATFFWKCSDLDADSLRVKLGASSVTLGGLLKHLAHMEDINFTRDLAGGPLPAPWNGVDPSIVSEWAWRSAADDTPDELYNFWQESADRSRLAVVDFLRESGPGGTYEMPWGATVSLRRLLVDMVEEYGRHTGHADLIRESIDGRVGEDPPGGPYEFHLD